MQGSFRVCRKIIHVGKFLPFFGAFLKVMRLRSHTKQDVKILSFDINRDVREHRTSFSQVPPT
jgi:hypothetical protein